MIRLLGLSVGVTRVLISVIFFLILVVLLVLLAALALAWIRTAHRPQASAIPHHVVGFWMC
jgi:hypothetical protein